uniref:Glycosyltransferase n=1 Tax=viral metagenome TaxID=1070528 RepID=A0A6C0KTF7_9ZZZZ
MINKTILKYIDEKKKYSKTHTKSLRILILCNPCHGFGDIVFAMKLNAYIKQWYGSTVHIGTTTPDNFLKLGADKKDIIPLEVIKIEQCRRFGNVTPQKPIKNYDLIFVAPLPMDNKISQGDITKLTPFANKNNTFFFSEYNDKLDKGFDFNTGIGSRRDGIFLTEVIKTKTNPFAKLGKYALAYLAEGIPNSQFCFLNFLELLTTKYKYKTFSVVAPSWISSIKDEQFFSRIHAHYSKIILHTKDEKIILLDEGENEIHIRCDILPLANKKMLSLMQNSVGDLLLTGDQSVTDALSCCVNKNIFYQIAPWKENFGKNLATYLPNKFLIKKRLSCGTTKAVSYKSNYKAFIRQWDFRTRGKPKLDAVMAYAVDEKQH